jgi:hypothetical protein
MIRSLSLSAALLAAVPALAGEVRVSRPIEAVSLHEGALDMVAYFTELEDGAYEVVATFAEKSGTNPMRVTLAVDDGDNVHFAVPGHKGSLYGFTRESDVLNVSVEDVPVRAAQADTVAAREI